MNVLAMTGSLGHPSNEIGLPSAAQSVFTPDGKTDITAATDIGMFNKDVMEGGEA